MKLSWAARGAASAERGRRLMALRGVTPNGYPLWEPREVAPVIGLYPDYQSILPELDRRTRPAVYNKAGRLGITKAGAPVWSDDEVLRLRKVYPKGAKGEILAAFPRRTYTAIAKAANARGIFRAKRPIPPTGNRLLDQVLSRAQKLNLSLRDMDELVRSRNYFKRRAWARRMDEAINYRAARKLGGVVRASFK